MVCRFFFSYSQHITQTSPGKNAYFHSIYLPHLHHLARIVLGFVLFGKLTHQAYALYAVRVPQTGALPPASFRFHLTVDTLVLGLTVGTINPRIGLSPNSKRPCWAHQKKGRLVRRPIWPLIRDPGSRALDSKVCGMG